MTHQETFETADREEAEESWEGNRGPFAVLAAGIALAFFIGWFFFGINSKVSGHLDGNIYHMDIVPQEGYLTVDYADDLANRIAEELFVVITTHTEVERIEVTVVTPDRKAEPITKISVKAEKLRGMHDLSEFESMEFVRKDLIELLKKGDKQHHLYFHHPEDGPPLP